ncbi:2-dehydro-3-deoxy-6-phosphogalactonate aldolase [Vibrio sp. ZSDE26]|uniref:2-dehydro-3-deoxy-6-phosphogalactonate aldolase n=1 Tax=Vibrio amylolyticus TaxID=2847292 RepID=A0A9X1XKK4_9VIBR|nr:2-dehydro-3-deoxy-6-phosphogalactonate aldolase [Vibrio amylolyticus]MCK6263413.1 2-dehydro-3-deoxy-6-phosphogalactonate aldolase [Vibrio amylolyticus]
MKNNDFNLNDHLPLVAIIRGILPDDCVRVTQILIEEGFSMIEVPLNSPDALTSIKTLVQHFGENFLIGAGTVTTAEKAQAVIDTGANLMVTPNFNEEVVKMSVAAGCVTFPGVVTPTEAFSALAAGATGLKLFPISMIGLDGFKALNSVLPPDTACLPVGGINPTVESMKPYLDIGAKGFGLGASLYKPGMSDEEIRSNAKAFNQSYTESIS